HRPPGRVDRVHPDRLDRAGALRRDLRRRGSGGPRAARRSAGPRSRPRPRRAEAAPRAPFRAPRSRRDLARGPARRRLRHRGRLAPTWRSPAQLVFTAPPRAGTGPVELRVTNPGGASAARADLLAYAFDQIAFANGLVFQSAGDSPGRPVLADIDGDGHLDLL